MNCEARCRMSDVVYQMSGYQMSGYRISERDKKSSMYYLALQIWRSGEKVDISYTILGLGIWDLDFRSGTWDSGFGA